MGEVYLARDTRLGREVAVKVLPADRLSDHGRRRRFVQEARAASALNHPNIVTIHEIDAADGIDFIVMEYVAGQPLGAVIPRQGMRLPDVMALAIPMAEALSRAHGAGIVHRDLKPANVMVGREGVVKILDFGLAKLVAPDGLGGDEDTSTMDEVAEPASRAGRIAGTPAYMSPEQATGGKVDARSDIFSFGILLYEMVTGRRPFSGATTEETRAAVAHDPPRPPSAHAPGLPRDLEKLILRCLQKDPDRRFQSMLDLRVELREIEEELASAPPVSPRHPPKWVVFTLIVAVLAVAAAVLSRRPAAPPSRVVPLTAMPGDERDAAFSPDGEQIAFSWDGGQTPEGETVNVDIWLKLVGASEVRRLTTELRPDRYPAWSPDGKQIAFVRGKTLLTGPRTIHLISPLGGSERKLSDFPAVNAQLAWSPDGRWIAVGRSPREPERAPQARGIYVLSVASGEYRQITSAEVPTFHAQPAVSPDGRWLAFTSTRREQSEIQVVAVDGDLATKGEPRTIARHIYTDGIPSRVAWSRDGQSIIFGTAHSIVFQLGRVDVSGNAPQERIELAARDACCPSTVASRDRLAYEIERENLDIYRWRPHGPAEPLLASSYQDLNPSISPDGQRIAFSSGRSGNQECWIANADGSGATQLTRGASGHRGGPRWSPDGQRILYSEQEVDRMWDVWTIDVDGANARRVTHAEGDSRGFAFSSDGRFVYFSSNRAGPYEIWRAPTAGGAAERVTTDGGTAAAVSLDGRTLVYAGVGPAQPLRAMELPSGPSRELAACVQLWGFAVSRVGVYYVACEPARSVAPLHVVDLASGQDRVIGTVPVSRLRAFQGMSVSADGSLVVFTKAVTDGNDIMMIDNFR